MRAKIAIVTLKYILFNKWETLSIEHISNKSKVSKKKITHFIKNKHDLLKNINQYFDDKILESSKLLDQSTSKDMLFEILMMRFDLLNQHRRSLIKIFDIFKKKPHKFILLLPSFINSMILIEWKNIIKIE